MPLLVHLAKKLSNYNFKARKFASFLIIAMVISSFFVIHSVFYLEYAIKNGCTQTVTVSTKLRTVSPSPFFIRCKTVRYGKLEAVVNLVGADFKQKRKDKAFKYYDIKGKGFKVYFV